MDESDKVTLTDILYEYHEKVKCHLSAIMGIVSIQLSNVSAIKSFQEKLEGISSIYNILNEKKINIFDNKRHIHPFDTAKNILLNNACNGSQDTYSKIAGLIENNGGKYYYINTLSGVRFDKNYTIDKDILLVNREEFPKELLAELQNSLGQEYAFELGGPFHRSFAALLFTGNFNIEDESSDVEVIPSTDSISFRISKKMNLITLLIPLLTGQPCQQLQHLSYLDKNVLLGTDQGSALALPEFNITTCREISIEVDKMELLLSSLLKIDDKSRQYLENILRRYNIACTRQNERDQAIELRLIIEMLLNVSGSAEPISDTISIRGSWLLGETIEDRLDYYNKLKKSYSLSSNAVHGSYKENSKNKVIINDLSEICKKILIKFMIIESIPRSKDEWCEIVLGGLVK